MSPQEKSESLKKVLKESPPPFDEADYYKSKQVEMGGEDVLDEDDEHEDDENLDEEEDV